MCSFVLVCVLACYCVMLLRGLVYSCVPFCVIVWFVALSCIIVCSCVHCALLFVLVRFSGLVLVSLRNVVLLCGIV